MDCAVGPDPDATGQNSTDLGPVLHPDQKPKSPFFDFIHFKV